MFCKRKEIIMSFKNLGQVVLNQDAISRGVNTVARQLNSDFEEAVIITVVPGGILFTADLVRQLNFDILMDYISCPHTPGERKNESQIVYHQNIDISDKDVIFVDDAIESGGTMSWILTHIFDFKVKSISAATLLVKPGRITIPFKQYFAYEMEDDDLLVGYGLPWQDRLRNIPYVCKLIK